MPNGLKIRQWNIRSLAPTQENHWKLDQLRMNLNSNNESDILGITESWLSDTIDESEVQISNYTCRERKD